MIGYACITLGNSVDPLRGCTKKNATNETLSSVIGHNLTSLSQALHYNHQNNIQLFRISSDIIPFGSSPVNSLPWKDSFGEELTSLGELVRRFKIRVSMHPGQYTVINSPHQDVVDRAIEDLIYHASFLDSLSLDASHKLILHIGGIYNEKEAAMDRFISVYQYLPENVKARLVIENDDRLYSVADVLAISSATGIPVVFDTLHHEVNPPHQNDKSMVEWLLLCKNTWKRNDGCQKIHYSQQSPSGKAGAHSQTIGIEAFLSFYHALEQYIPSGDLPDIMLEVKDKNLSAVKCINSLAHPGKIRTLEEEWSRYKYNVLEHDHAIYLKIRALLKDKTIYPAVEFYRLLEAALSKTIRPEAADNAAAHVWGYMSPFATQKEKEAASLKLTALHNNEISSDLVKKFLYRLAVKYEQTYLLDSFYFTF